ncbi:BatA domain-containing protein [Maribacter sp. MMG018]|uniref:BatA domain-containing protein n=1 Tax=Maribacter sp. MMG018 TaxID=2822688 RepID=UPI001B38A2A5|nr:BatA domain-containing protein [Maribacter sp. MMG018]MBQ4915501.1 BatA domain-containing protein [Maribacter sp. MMG018]
MQFKHPEILWALLLLIIPIIVHLFQLRRFKKTPFTNVKLLKKVVSESRKSSSLKKWLILLCRLGLFAALIVAFAQPFSANNEALKPQETVFYIDNSFSLQAKTPNGTLLQNTIQDFIKETPENSTFSLFTNDRVFENVAIKDIRNDLIDLAPSVGHLQLDQIILRANSLFSNRKETLKKTILISDFQTSMGPLPTDSLPSDLYFIKSPTQDITNISIDSVFISKSNNEIIELTSLLSSNKSMDATPVSLYNGDKLIAKTAATFDTDKKAAVTFSVPAGEAILGRIVISDTGLLYDNQFYFNLNTVAKIKVLAISNAEAEYLQRIYTEDEFDFTNTDLANLNYGSLEDYNLIVLNELEQIPTGLSTVLNTFTKNGGSIVIIPATEIQVDSYNQLCSTYFNTTYTKKIEQPVAISEIAFDHNIYTDVFERNVANFQYPKVNGYYGLQTNAQIALALQNKAPFLAGNDNVYFFSAAISDDNANFKNSPLIVPTFYNIAKSSLKLPSLYTTLGEYTELEIPISLSKDNILTVVKDDYEFIPQQRSLPKKVRLIFEENPTTDGIFEIRDNGQSLQNISFNYNRTESRLSYLNLENQENINYYDTILNFFEDTQKTNRINEFWKWFAILALVFVVLETILQRLLK